MIYRESLRLAGAVALAVEGAVGLVTWQPERISEFRQRLYLQELTVKYIVRNSIKYKYIKSLAYILRPHYESHSVALTQYAGVTVLSGTVCVTPLVSEECVRRKVSSKGVILS